MVKLWNLHRHITKCKYIAYYVVFFLTLSGISCVTILKYTLILSPQFTKSTENKTTSNQKEK